MVTLKLSFPHSNNTTTNAIIMTHTAHIHHALEAKDAAAPSRRYQAQFDQFPESWKSIILECELKQLTLKSHRTLGKDWSDKIFTEHTSLPSSTWSLLKSGNHALPTGARSIDNVLAKLKQLQQRCKEIDLEAADAALRARQNGEVQGFVQDVNVTAIKGALNRASERASSGSEERLIVLRGSTGDGKTTLRKHLVAQGDIHFSVMARPSWKSSYTAFLRAVAATLRVDVSNLRGVATVETEILDKATRLNGAIWFEEVQRLSRQAQEFIKTLLNESTLTVLISLTPEAYRLMQHQAGADFAQLFRRAAANFEMTPASAKFVQEIAPELWSKSHTPRQREIIAEEAAKFGGKALIAEVTKRLTRITADRLTITDSDVTQAIRDYRLNVPDFARIRRTFGQPEKAAA